VIWCAMLYTQGAENTVAISEATIHGAYGNIAAAID